ncbi:MAG: hypothetical protein ACKODM_06125 [Cytophagales bacterium]
MSIFHFTFIHFQFHSGGTRAIRYKAAPRAKPTLGGLSASIPAALYLFISFVLDHFPFSIN